MGRDGLARERLRGRDRDIRVEVPRLKGASSPTAERYGFAPRVGYSAMPIKSEAEYASITL